MAGVILKHNFYFLGSRLTSNMTIRPLSLALQRKAEKEINENSKRVAEDIQTLKVWFDMQPHLKTVKPTDQWLVAFLRGCKFSLERSKEKLDLYYTLKAIVPEFFSDRDPLTPRIQEMLKAGLFLPLRRCQGEDSSRICIVRIGAYDPSQYHLSDLIKVSFMITEILMLEDDNFTVSGEEVLVDMDGAGMNVLTQWTPTLAKKVISSFEKALPVRVRSTHIINTPTGFQTVYAIFRKFLGEKLKKRIKVYKKIGDSLYKDIPKKLLPTEYGGEDGSVQELIDYWKDKVESRRDWFLKEQTAHSDESKRHGAPKTSSDVFGIEGSFRKIDVD